MVETRYASNISMEPGAVAPAVDALWGARSAL
jgi:hypothetical protein